MTYFDELPSVIMISSFASSVGEEPLHDAKSMVKKRNNATIKKRFFMAVLRNSFDGGILVFVLLDQSAVDLDINEIAALSR